MLLWFIPRNVPNHIQNMSGVQRHIGNCGNNLIKFISYITLHSHNILHNPILGHVQMNSWTHDKPMKTTLVKQKWHLSRLYIIIPQTYKWCLSLAKMYSFTRVHLHMTFNQGMSDVNRVEKKCLHVGFRKHVVFHEIYRWKFKVVNSYFKLIIFIRNI